jgi:hypothetical protein
MENNTRRRKKDVEIENKKEKMERRKEFLFFLKG